MNDKRFYESYFFRERFNREPKLWTLEKLHSLYLLSKDRSDKRRKEFSDHIEHIIEEVETDNSRQEIKVYFEEDDKTYVYKITKSLEWGWGYSSDTLKWSSNNVEARNEKISFLLENKKNFELGEEMRRLERLKSRFEHRVFGHITTRVDKALCEKFKNVKNYNMSKILKVNIAGYIYLVQLTEEARKSSYSYKKFEITELENNEIIKL
jgi:hypothetical protein